MLRRMKKTSRACRNNRLASSLSAAAERVRTAHVRWTRSFPLSWCNPVAAQTLTLFQVFLLQPLVLASSGTGRPLQRSLASQPCRNSRASQGVCLTPSPATPGFEGGGHAGAGSAGHHFAGAISAPLQRHASSAASYQVAARMDMAPVSAAAGRKKEFDRCKELDTGLTLSGMLRSYLAFLRCWLYLRGRRNANPKAKRPRVTQMLERISLQLHLATQSLSL